MQASGLKRRMNNLERVLITTVIVLIFILMSLTLSVRLLENKTTPYHHTRQFLPQLQSLHKIGKELNAVGESGDSSKVARSINQVVDSRHNGPGSSEAIDLDGSYFLPGALNISRTESLHKCFFSSDIHLPRGQGCSVSEDYKVVLHLTPKSGSSTGRHVIKSDFNGVDYFTSAQCRGRGEEWFEFAILRNPATRAFASYEEMFVRRLGIPELIPANTRSFMEPFRGWIYKNYSSLFDTVEGVRKLNDAYEQFMQDWDGKAFDMHLESQVAYNMRPVKGCKSHSSKHLRLVFDTHSMQESFDSLANLVGLNKKPKVIRGRSYPRRLNVSHVSDQAFQAMCRRYRHDFCCLNYKLPEQCLNNVPIGQRVRCRWIQNGPEQMIDAVVV